MIKFLIYCLLIELVCFIVCHLFATRYNDPRFREYFVALKDLSGVAIVFLAFLLIYDVLLV